PEDRAEREEEDDDEGREDEAHHELRGEVRERRHGRRALPRQPAEPALEREGDAASEEGRGDDAERAVGRQEVDRVLAVALPEDEPEEDVEHRREEERRDREARRARDAQDLGAALEEVEPGPFHAATSPSFAVSARNASPRSAPFTSRPRRPGSRARSS